MPSGSCEHPVGVEEAVDKAVSIATAALAAPATSTSLRKSPLVLCRCARGGKTTVLNGIHNALKKRGVRTLLISFNDGFARLNGESEEHALYRLITNKLNGSFGTDRRRLIDWETLSGFIGSGSFVLLIDEINRLRPTVSATMYSILTRYFLDPQNRYLIMSSHIPIHINEIRESSHLWSISTASNRLIKLLQMPSSHSVDALRNMHPDCNVLTPDMVAFYGEVPSIIYAVLSNVGENTDTRVNTAFHGEALSDRLFSDFAKTLIYGKPDTEILKKFAWFCSHTIDSGDHSGPGFVWPLCYIAAIMAFFRLPLAKRIREAIMQLKYSADIESAGIAWEVVVRVALMLQLHCVAYDDSVECPLNLCDVGEAKRATVLLHALNVNTVEDAGRSIAEFASTHKQHALVLFYPMSSTFPQFDLFVAHIKQGDVVNVSGVQCKEGKASADGIVPAWVTKGGYLLRQTPVETTNSTPKSRRWTSLTRKEMKELLGFSLSIMLRDDGKK